MNPNDKDENAKDLKWRVPTGQSSVKPEDYPSDVDSANGSADPTSAGSRVGNSQRS